MAFGYQNPYGWNAPGYGQPMLDQLAQLRGAQGYPQGYPHGYYQQGQQMPPQGAQQQAQQGGGLNWVQGEAGAKSYMVAPGATVLLMDSENQTFYLKSADAGGVPQPLRIFDYKERTVGSAMTAQQTPQADYVTREEFNRLAARLEEMASEKPDMKHAKEGE